MRRPFGLVIARSRTEGEVTKQSSLWTVEVSLYMSEIAALPGVQRRSARNDRLVVPVALFCHCEEPDRRGGDEAI